MKLIVGLGNPGNEFQNTRHNIGFMVIDEYAKQHSVNINQKKFDALSAEIIINGEKVILVKPQTYMNLSGIAIKRFVDYYKINIADILIIHDDLDLSFGTYRLRLSGSSGGHNGLKSINEALNTQDYKRLKIGISNDKTIDTKDYVLGHFNNNDKDIVNNIIDKAMLILDDYLILSFVNLMNKYNKRDDTV